MYLFAGTNQQSLRSFTISWSPQRFEFELRNSTSNIPKINHYHVHKLAGL